jgi:hypothetical protein
MKLASLVRVMLERRQPDLARRWPESPVESIEDVRLVRICVAKFREKSRLLYRSGHIEPCLMLSRIICPGAIAPRQLFDEDLRAAPDPIRNF